MIHKHNTHLSNYLYIIVTAMLLWTDVLA